MEELKYRLDSFEGPLDLLLTLIAKSKVDITDIPIAEICDQYMKYIEEARRMDLDIASEFIVMASELMLIKSKMLLPREIEENGDPRTPLIDALLLYKRAKETAALLKPIYDDYSGRMIKEGDEIPPEKGFPLGLNPELLTKALNSMLFRLRTLERAPTKLITPLMSTRIVPVEEKTGRLISCIETQGRASLFFLLKDEETRADVLASFLGILELIKLGRIRICAIEDTESDDDGLEVYDYDDGLTISFELNPDYVPDEDNHIESEFSHDRDSNFTAE